MDWREEAACSKLPWEYRAWFWGEGNSLQVHEQHERARMVCYLCPVQMECLRYWVDTDGDFGVWGGLTESQRKRYLKPLLRKQETDEAMFETVWKLGVRLFPKIKEAFVNAGEKAPELPAQEPVSTKVLVQILSSEREALLAS